LTLDEYQSLALRTESPPVDTTGQVITAKLLPPAVRTLHGAMGLCSEAGELIDPLKKHVFYGKPLDFTNIAEEIGDILWYAAIVADACGTTLGKIAAANVAKLKQRYGEKFSEEAALARDLEAERMILEQHIASGLGVPAGLADSK